MIQATAFHEQATQLDKLMVQDGVYTISEAFVKMANKRFTSIDNDYCIVFSKESKVEKCADDVDIQSNSYNFTGLEDINDIVQSKKQNRFESLINSKESQ